MIIYLLLMLFSSLLYLVVSLIPTIETPLWILNNLPVIIQTIAGFNYYLPVADGIVAVVFLISTTLIWYVVKVFISPFFKL